LNRETQYPLQAAEYLKLWQTLFFLDVENLLRHPAEITTVDLEKLADHTCCKTGQWLAEQAESVRELPEFKALDLAHRQFHANVAVSLECLRLGSDIESSDSNEDIAQSYDRATFAVDRLIDRLRQTGLLDTNGQDRSLRLWDTSFEVGVEEIDRQHRTIMTLIELASPNVASPYVGLSAETITRKLFKLIRSELEVEAPIIRQMINAGIDSAKEHEQAHLGLLQLIASAEAEDIPVNSLAKTLGSWYVEHLVVYDEEMRGFCAGHHCDSGSR